MALAQHKLDSSALETVHQQQQQQEDKSYESSAAVVHAPLRTENSAMEEIDYESLPTEKLSTHLCAGAAAGMMEHTVMYPVDCVKVTG